VTVRFVVTDTAKTIPVEYRGILPDLFKEGKGVVAQGKLERRRRLPRPGGAGQARRELHAARGRHALERAAQGRRQQAQQHRGHEPGGPQAMIPELGHFALVVALFIALALGTLPLVGAARGDVAWMALARPAAQAQFVFVALALRLPDVASFVQRLLGASTWRPTPTATLPLPYRIAASLGQPRGLDAAVGASCSRLGRAVSLLQPLPLDDGGARARRDGPRQRRLPAVHAAHLQPLRAPAAAARRTAAT
jgi:hypothetical protein